MAKMLVIGKECVNEEDMERGVRGRRSEETKKEEGAEMRWRRQYKGEKLI